MRQDLKYQDHPLCVDNMKCDIKDVERETDSATNSASGLSCHIHKLCTFHGHTIHIYTLICVGSVHAQLYTHAFTVCTSFTFLLDTVTMLTFPNGCVYCHSDMCMPPDIWTRVQSVPSKLCSVRLPQFNLCLAFLHIAVVHTACL